MITDQKVELISSGPFIVRVHRGARFYRGVIALLDGDGVLDRPLHFVLLGCHADMADEAPVATTEQLTSALAEAVLTRLQDQQDDIREALQTSNAAAAATDRYYSIVVGRVMQRNVIIGAVGKVDAIVARKNTRTSIITPNVVRIGEHAILDGAFGIGFKEEAVSVKQIDLKDDAMLLLMIGGDAIAISDTEPHQNAEALIENVVHAARVSPPIVAVVR